MAMTIRMVSTTELFEMGGSMKVRRWHGVTDKGTPCDVMVQSVRPLPDAPPEHLEKLREEVKAWGNAIDDRSLWIHLIGEEDPIS